MMQIWVLSKVPLNSRYTPKNPLAVLNGEIKIRQFFFFFSLVETDFQAKSGHIKHNYLASLNILTI